MFVDILITIFVIGSIFRGRDLGFVRQLCSTTGFFSGLFLGAWLEPHAVGLAHTPGSRSLITLITTLGCALVLLSVGEYIGILLKHRVVLGRINSFDNGLGAVLGMVTLLLSVWLAAGVITSLPFPGLQSALRSSRIIASLNQALPSAPGVIADLGQLIDPNGFPEVFIGHEPSPPPVSASLPSSAAMQAAVAKDRNSVVKVEGGGCGGVVEGSGFVAAPGLVVTNAHVVAGIKNSFVEDANGIHGATVIWFDPDLDLAVLRARNLAGGSLNIATAYALNGTPAEVIGYPGGGAVSASAAAVLEEFTAIGRNIYGSGHTNRDVYEIQASVIPGNSGGPLVTEDGSVIGVVFAESTTYNHIGYALTTPAVIAAINHAVSRNQVVSTGNCAE